MPLKGVQAAASRPKTIGGGAGDRGCATVACREAFGRATAVGQLSSVPEIAAAAFGRAADGADGGVAAADARELGDVVPRRRLPRVRRRRDADRRPPLANERAFGAARCQTRRRGRRRADQKKAAAPENALVELDWSPAALWAGCLYAKRQQIVCGEDLARTSVAGVLRILRRALREPELAIAPLMAAALVDQYSRPNKASRAYPRKKTDAPGTDPPRILKARKDQVTLAAEINRLTA